MDQIKIGKFIAEMRKEQNLTQKQLAEKLMISDKTVSKWETGKGLPEVSLMRPLCEILGMNLNELFSGERLSDAAYQRKAEENIMKFAREKEESRKKITVSIFSGVMSTLVLVVMILLVAFYAEVIALPVKIAVIVFACVVFGMGLFVTMFLDRDAGYFECQHCNEVFTPTWTEYIFAFQYFGKRRLKCPNCKQTTLTKRAMSKD